ncbi:MAG: PAS domain S-box protein, partial [Rhodospirillales bacterium]|nr:PAS domain S-box protein [Rhodospirillales bacterium]
LYATAFAEQRLRLVETAKSQARLMEAVARFDQKYSSDYPQGSLAATLSQIRDAHANHEGFHGKGVFTLARREGDRIVFLLRHRRDDIDTPRPVAFTSALAEPMRRALSGESGTVVGLDNRGTTVLAAHEPVAVLNLGIVAKIDLAEIRAPFARAGMIVGGIAVVFILAGTVLFFRVSDPIARELWEGEERFRGMFERTDVPMALRETDGRIRMVNAAFCKMFGYPEGELEGMSFWDINHQEDLAGSLERHRQLIAGEIDVAQAEKRYVRKDGHVIWGHGSVSSVRDARGKVLYTVGQYQDITDRKRAEEALRESEARFKSVTDNSPSLIYLKDTKGRYLFVNKEFERRQGISNNDIVGKTAYDFFPDEIAAAYSAHEQEVIKTGSAVQKETAAFHPEIVGYNLTVKFPILDDTGEVVGVGGISTDIAERKQAEEELEVYRRHLEDLVEERTHELSAAKDIAEAANRTKSEFLANMSHELRTPLNAILGFSNVMQEELHGPLKNEKYREYVDDIHKSGEHLLELINDILDLSKIEAKALVLEEKPMDLHKVSEAIIRLIRPRAEKGRIAVTNKVGRDLPFLFGDERRVKQILFNLLSNATKFTDAGGSVILDANMNKDECLALMVSDTGIGMDETELDTAFSTFGQIDGTLAREHEGAGLGLPLTRALVELHGATMTVKSMKGEGTEVTVEFPPERTLQEG